MTHRSLCQYPYPSTSSTFRRRRQRWRRRIRLRRGKPSAAILLILPDLPSSSSSRLIRSRSSSGRRIWQGQGLFLIPQRGLRFWLDVWRLCELCSEWNRVVGNVSDDCCDGVGKGMVFCLFWWVGGRLLEFFLQKFCCLFLLVMLDCILFFPFVDLGFVYALGGGGGRGGWQI